MVLKLTAGIRHALRFNKYSPSGARLSMYRAGDLAAAGIFHSKAVSAVPLADKGFGKVIAVLPANKRP